MVTMIESVIVCMLSMTPLVAEMDTYINCRSDEKKIEVVEQWIPLIQTHFDTQQEQRKALTRLSEVFIFLKHRDID